MSGQVIVTDDLSPRSWHQTGNIKPTVVITDRDKLDLDAYEAGLSFFEQLRVVGATTSAEEVIDLCLSHKANIAVLDFDILPGGAFEAALELRSHHPEISVLIIGDRLKIGQSARLFVDWRGGLGLITRSSVSSMDALAQAICIVANGGRVIAPEILKELLDVSAPERPFALTPREWTVMQLLSNGMSDASIADRLGLSRRTVENVVGHAKVKLQPVTRLVQRPSAIIELARLQVEAMDHPVIAAHADIHTRRRKRGPIRLALVAQRIVLRRDDRRRRQTRKVLRPQHRCVRMCRVALRTDLVIPEIDHRAPGQEIVVPAFSVRFRLEIAVDHRRKERLMA